MAPLRRERLPLQSSRRESIRDDQWTHRQGGQIRDDKADPGTKGIALKQSVRGSKVIRTSGPKWRSVT